MDAGPSYIKNLNSQLNAVKLAHIALCKGKPAFVAQQQTGVVYSTFGV
jgi:hypothetical protein